MVKIKITALCLLPPLLSSTLSRPLDTSSPVIMFSITSTGLLSTLSTWLLTSATYCGWEKRPRPRYSATMLKPSSAFSS